MSAYNNILIIGKVWPEPKSSAAGTRMMQLIQFFKGQNARITFASTANPSDFQVDLEELNINMVSITLNSDTFDIFIKELNPTMVVFDRFMTEEQFGWRVMEQCPDALRVLNTEDMHFLRDARGQALKEGRTIDINHQTDLQTDKTFREISAIYRSDIALLVSEVEMEMLKQTFQVPEHLLYYLPVFAQERPPDIPSFEVRKDFLFIGNFLHEPNWDGVRYLKQEIWPLIRKGLPGAVITVYGAYSSQKVFDLHNTKEGFLVHGRADNAMEVTMDARVSLAPIRFGAGIKGKLIEAMVCGTPSITTTMGAESMQHNNLWNGCITDDPEEFAQAAIELYSDANKWKQAQDDGFEIIENRYLAKSHLPQFGAKLKEVYENLNAHRAINFTSKLMQHQTLMSARYLSKWIMEKEKIGSTYNK
ncbi:MAG: glycosyltransferase family 4 protein [Crocinitomicaceae bacterium]|nr:glycosyltransferase family 4 protein [Crocinitomicaceae bacterium]